MNVTSVHIHPMLDQHPHHIDVAFVCRGVQRVIPKGAISSLCICPALDKVPRNHYITLGSSTIQRCASMCIESVYSV